MTKIKTRKEMDPHFTWDLGNLYQNDEHWENDYTELKNQLNNITIYKGKLNESGETLLSCFNETSRQEEKMGLLYMYANLKHDEDSNNPVYQAMTSRAQNLLVALSTVTSFISPEIISIDQDRLNNFITNTPGLQVYKHLFDNLQRESNYILSQEKEQILAMVSEVTSAPSSIFSMLNNADIKFEKVTDSIGNKKDLTHSLYANYLESQDRTLRENTFNSFSDSYINQKNTIAEIYNYSVKKDVFFSKVRGYSSSLEASLSSDNIPVSIYKNLINTVNSKLHLLHRYMDIRKKILNIKDLQMYDLNVPLTENVNTDISYEKAKSLILEGLSPLGEDYVKNLNKAFKNKWIDVYENKFKRPGAYSSGTYGAHPFILMNYSNKVKDMFTLSHELGHALHSYYTFKTQPFVYGGYTIFLAEIASTINESLLMDHLLKTTKDTVMGNYLLNYFIEQFRGILFRQTMFAEFEMITHEMSENGEALTTDSLSKIYKNLVIKYYGPGVIVNEKVSFEWSRIPHFYRAFYVFQYATGFSCAIALSKKILKEGEVARKKYITLLKSGSSDYSIKLLKNCGIDMTSPKPIEDALSVFKDLLDKLEEANK